MEMEMGKSSVCRPSSTVSGQSQQDTPVLLPVQVSAVRLYRDSRGNVYVKLNMALTTVYFKPYRVGIHPDAHLSTGVAIKPPLAMDSTPLPLVSRATDAEVEVQAPSSDQNTIVPRPRFASCPLL